MPATNNQLSEREQEILRFVATGASNKEIAKELYISTNTVKVHLRNIFAKIGVNSRTEAAMYAVNTGIVPSAQPSSGEGGSMDEIELSLEGGSNWSYTGLILFLIIAGLALVTFFLWRSTQPTSEGADMDVPTSQWETLAPMLTARSSLAVEVYENQIYAIAGDTGEGVTNVVERYDPESDEWASLASKPTAVKDVGAAVIGGKIYVPGGQLASGKTSDILEIYDPREDSWSQGAPLPEALSAYAIATYEGKLYLFGGWDGDNYLDTVYAYDPVSDEWENKNPLPSKRAYAGVTNSGEKILLIGGYDGKSILDLVESYSPDLEDGDISPWGEGVSLPSGRYEMGVGSIADVVYIFGGVDSSAQIPASFELTAQSGEWREIGNPDLGAWKNGRLVHLGAKLYLVGGERNSEITDLNLSYKAIYTISIPMIR